MSPGKFAVLLLASVGMLSSGGSAARAQCTDDSSCLRGFTCEVTGGSTCAGSAEPMRMCPAGAACDRPAMNPAPPDCKAETYRSCVPADCTRDSDCADGMICYAQQTGTCAVTPAAPCQGGICPPRQPPACMESITRSCVPRHLLPCQQASDCGGGFTCEPQMQCGCSGSAGGPTPARDPAPMDGGAARAADAGIDEADALIAAPNCSCTPTEEKYCKPVERICRIDSDCPALWSCRTTTIDLDRPACAAPQPGDARTCPAPAIPTVDSRCVPPYDGVNVGVGRDAAGESGVPTSGGGTTPPVAAPVPQTGSPADGDEAAPYPRHVSACAVASAGSNEVFGWWTGVLSLLAAAAFVTRRRTR